MFIFYHLISSAVAALSLSTYSVPASDASVYSFGAFPESDATSLGTTTAIAATSTASTIVAKSLTNSTGSVHHTLVDSTGTKTDTSGAMQLQPFWAAFI